MMKAVFAAIAVSICSSAICAEPAADTHRFLVERTFPAGALDGVDAAVKQKVNANNQSLGVAWEKSYTNPDKTRTYCIYTAPDAAAVKKAANLNGMTANVVTEIPNDIKPEPRGAVQHIARGNHRYLVKRTGTGVVSGSADAKFGVTLLTSYGTSEVPGSYSVYEAPSMSAVEDAAKAAGSPFESIVEIPDTLYPH